jgi:hypothetical protein
VTVWYEQLREQYRPDRLEVLLIGESPPDPGAGERRFFYASTLQIDNLYRGVAQALYGDHPDVELRALGNKRRRYSPRVIPLPLPPSNLLRGPTGSRSPP